MNHLTGTVRTIQNAGALSLVQIQLIDKQCIWSLVVEQPTDSPFLQKGKKLGILFKESEVFLFRDPPRGLDNCLLAQVKQWTQGPILCEVEISMEQFLLKALITTREFHNLALQEGEAIHWLVKPSSIALNTL